MMKNFPNAKVTLLPGGRGDFVVKVDGTILWDKRKMDDKFPDEAALINMLRSK